MNSVMDDNKMLTLASNERIPLKAHMRMIFEIRDLNHATPATVSRAGIIFISTNTGSQWRSLIKSWLVRLEAPEQPVKSTLRTLFERYCAPSLLYIKKECKPLVPVEDVTLVTNLLRMLKVLLTPAVMKTVCDPATPADEATRILDTYFVFAAVWAFGSALSLRDGEDYRAKFSDFWRGELKTVRLPSRETVFDYWLAPETLQFEQWKNSPHYSEITYDSKTTPMSQVRLWHVWESVLCALHASFSCLHQRHASSCLFSLNAFVLLPSSLARLRLCLQVTVPTPETCSISYWMELLVGARDPVMLVGYAGCGKTQLVQGLLSKQKPEERVSHAINFNFYTDSKALQVRYSAHCIASH